MPSSSDVPYGHEVDALIEEFLKASGSSFMHYSMPKAREEMREVMTRAMMWKPEQPKPVATAERLPTADDADCKGNVWAYDVDFKRWDLRGWQYTCRDVAKRYWLPTGLTLPPTPTEAGGE